MSNLVAAHPPILKAVGIKKSFLKGKQQIPVIRGIDLEIAPGERVAITGASGAGKSTLLHILGTLESPSAGKVFFGPEQQDLFRYSEKALCRFRNRALGFVFQFHYLLPEFSAVENVMMPSLISGQQRATARAQATELLQFVGLGHRLEHRPSELSGGEQQRVAVARAVILKPKLLLADELTGNLDSANRDHMMSLLIRLNEVTGISILLVTHDSFLTSQMNRVLTMKDGLLAESN